MRCQGASPKTATHHVFLHNDGDRGAQPWPSEKVSATRSPTLKIFAVQGGPRKVSFGEAVP